MKLLVLAQTPPPLHGQSVMVQTLVEGLPAHGIEVRPVPFNFSASAAEIGRARLGKIMRAFEVVRRARAALREQRCDAVYYVPAPGKRAAVWRDILVMGRLRRECPRLILHFHAAGIGAWLRDSAAAMERTWFMRAMAKPDLGIVLTPSLRADAVALGSRSVAVVPNGIADPGGRGSGVAAAKRPGPPRVLFLGALAVGKGVGVLIESVHQLHRDGPAVELVLAGAPASSADERTLREASRRGPATITWAGFVTGREKRALLESAALLCLPTFYPHEAQPLVLLEALAHDLPVVATRWRGISETLPPGCALAEPRDASSLTAALRTTLASPPPPGRQRAYFLEHYTTGRHLEQLAHTLRSSSQA